MTIVDLQEARERREDVLLAEVIDSRLDVLLSAKTVSPEARVQLRHLLSHYAKQAHPFRACVRDNMKRFGPGRTEKVCATLKDIIRGTTKWRRGGNHPMVASDVPQISPETEAVLLSLRDEDLDDLMQEAMLHA